MASHQEQRAPVATTVASSSPASVPCSLNPADYQWGTPSNAVLCQQFFQLQLLYNNPFAFPGQAPAAMLQFPFPGAAPPAAGAPQAAAQRPPFSFPACAFPPLPFAAGFLPGGFMACAGMQQPQQPAAVQAPAPKPADAPAHAKAAQSAAAPAVNSSVPAKANSKAKASRATKPAKVAPSTPVPTQAEAFDLSADEFSKLLEDSFLPDLDASACRSGLPASTSASELSEQPAAAGSPRDSGCNNHFADPFSAAMDDALPMDFDAFELDLDLLGPCDGPAPPAAPAQQLASVATAPPKKLASGDLNNMQLGRAASVGGSPRAKAKASTVKATVAGPAGGVQKVSGAAKAASSGKATAHASKAAVAATVQDAPYANDLLSFDDARLDGGLPWDLDLPDTIDFENPFSTPVTVC